MRIIIIILSFNALTANGQDTAKWRVGDERTIFQYNVQKSPDTSFWTTIATLEKGKSSYWYILPKETNYYRVQASGLQTFVTKPILLTVGTANRATITNAVKTSTTLSWNVAGENNVNYYHIQKTYDSKKYSSTTKIYATGKGKYSYRYSRTFFTYKYIVTPVFKDLSRGLPTTFK